MRQPNLFSKDVIPIRRMLYNVRLSMAKLPKKGYPYRSIQDLLAFHEALLSGDPKQLSAAGVTPEAARELILRLQTAIGERPCA